ncbi:unnamed protein product [Rotaria socialis]
MAARDFIKYNLKPSPNPNPNRAPPRNPTPRSQPAPNLSNPNGGTVVNVGAIAAVNYILQGKDMPNLIPTKEKIRQMLNDANIYGMYQAGSYYRKQRIQWLSYQKLASCRSINSVIDIICGEVRNKLSDLFNKFSNPITFEWVIMIDNSGSMSIYDNYIHEAVISILETLRKLECRVAVGRFGNRSEGSQVILKSFDQPSTFHLGQMVLEGLTFCESSHIPIGITAIAVYTWGHSNTTSANNAKRIVLVIAYALSTEIREDKDQFTERKKRDQMKDLDSSLKQVSDNLCLSIDPSDASLKSLSSSTSSLLISAFQKMIQLIHSSSTSTLSRVTNNNENLKNEGKSILFCLKTKNLIDYTWPVEKSLKPTIYEDALENDGSGSIATSLCYVSTPTNTLPYEDDTINSMQQENK